MDEPRKAWPGTPSSVSMVTRPSWLLPLKRPVWRPYVVAGMSSQAKSVRRTSVIFMVGRAYHGPRLLLQQHAMPRVEAQEDVRALGHRRRGDAAEDEAPTVPVEMVLGEVALEDPAPHARGPHVAPPGGALA